MALPVLSAVDGLTERELDTMLALMTEREKFDPSKLCYPQQLAYVRSTSKRKVLRKTRRAGGTVALAVSYLEEALKPPFANQLYVTSTLKNAKRLIWPTLKKFNTKYNLGGVPNETEAFMRFPKLPNEPIIYLGGAKDSAEIEKIRGYEGGLKRAAIDECFPAGTLIDGRPIEMVRLGDLVSCVDHVTGTVTDRRVVRLFERSVDGLVRIDCPGVSLSCTGNHPVFVKGRGYVEAEEVVQGDMLCVRPSVREGQGGKNVQPGLSEPLDERRIEGSKNSNVSGRTATVVGVDDSKESNEVRRNQREGGEDSSKNEAPSFGPRRQRDRSDASGIRTRVGYQLAHERHSEHGNGWLEKAVRLSDLLQAGCGGRVDQDMYRGRWSQPLRRVSTETGREEDGILEWTRVESVSRDEPGSPGGTAVYNLEVEGAHTYFANGVLVHNCQAIRTSILSTLVDDVIEPSLFDYDGELDLVGTPSPVPAGYFYDVDAGDAKSGWEHFFLDLRMNPYLAQKSGKPAEQILAELRSRRNWTEDNTTYRREYLGEWVTDSDALALHYDPKKNACEWQETRMPGWRYILAFDIGYDDADAIGVLGWAPHVRKLHLVKEVIRRKQGITALGDQLKALYAIFKPTNVIGDLGALGKKIGEELKQRWSLPVEAAEKSRKAEHVGLLDDALITGNFLAPPNSVFAEDCAIVQWDQDAKARGKLEFDTSYHSDILDGVLYGFRLAYHWTENTTVKAPTIFDEDELLKSMLVDPQDTDRPDYT